MIPATGLWNTISAIIVRTASPTQLRSNGNGNEGELIAVVGGNFMKRKDAHMRSFLSLLALLIAISTVQATTTGKIRGRVTDDATKHTLVGANVVIEGMMLGAATDLNGEYYILQVPPGIYNVRILMIGYKELLITDVKVMSGHTTTIDGNLPQMVLEAGGEVTVVAKRKIIQEDITTSTQFVSDLELRQLPVSDTKTALMNQTGVFFNPIPVSGGISTAGKGEARYSIRGGNQDEVLWFINGVQTASMYFGQADMGGSFTNVNLNSVREIQVISGGFDAEYGNAQSGIVNIITKEGSGSFKGSAELIYGPPGQHHFGNYLYDIADTTIKEFGDHYDPETGELDTAWWTPYRQNQVYDYRKIPSYTYSMSLGGPLFSIGDGLATFFISSQVKQEAYTLPRPRDSRNTENIHFNLSFPLNPKMKLRLEYLYNHEAHSSMQGAGDFVPQAKYYRGWGSLLDTYTALYSLHWNQTISSSFFYDLKLSYYRFENIEGPGKYSMIGESDNPNIWGYQRYNITWEDSLNFIEPFDAWASSYDVHWINSDLSAVGSLNWQFDQANMIKAGFEYRYNTLDEISDIRYVSYNRDPRYWFNRGLHEEYHPIQFAAYIQDKMEFQSMILNIGLRYDYFNPNREWFVSEGLFNLNIDPDYDRLADPDGDQVDSLGHVKYSWGNTMDKPRESVDAYHMVSPRFGVSFPITEKTVLHYNYGHYYQLPSLDKMFYFRYFRPETVLKGVIATDQEAEETGEEPVHAPSVDGDPERVVALTPAALKPEKTISFEVGVKHNFNDFAVLDVTAFYKDVFDQTEELFGIFDRRFHGWDPFTQETTPTRFYTGFLSGDYGDSRGFEINLRTLFSNDFTIDLNYSFSKSVQGRASPFKVLWDEEGNVSYVWDEDLYKRIPVEKSFSRPHIFRANFYARYPDRLSVPIFSPIFRGTSASILYSYVSGQAFTYLDDDDPPETYNNHRYPAIITTDLRLNKDLKIGKNHLLTAYIRITNLFNRKNLRSIGDQYNGEALFTYFETGEPTSVDLLGYDISAITYYEPRRIYLGLKYQLR
ncbi:MAG: TonB-dependent receptor [Candidatus Neomarinimicrobiota bacterium]